MASCDNIEIYFLAVIMKNFETGMYQGRATEDQKAKISKEEHVKWRAKQKAAIQKAKSELLNPQFSVVSKEGKSFELGSWKQLAA